MAKEIQSLEVALRTESLSYVAEFMTKNGYRHILELLKKYSTKTMFAFLFSFTLQSSSNIDEREIQHQLIRCIRTIMKFSPSATFYH